jgi:hypothetical protein
MALRAAPGKPLAFSLLVLFSLLWLVTPWGRAVAAFVSGLVLFYVLFLSSLVSRLDRRCAAFAAAVAAPFLLSAFFEPAFLWYPAAVLASFAWFVYLSSRLYGALWGFLYAVAVGLLHLAILAALNAASGGLLWRAYEVGFDVYERWNVPVVAAADSAAMWASAEALARPWRRLSKRV